MAHLNGKGVVSAIELVFYLPILFLSLFLIFKHGVARKGGWIYLVIFSIIRIVGAAIYINVSLQSTPSIGLFATAIALQAAGLSPLLFATLGFVTIVSSHSSLQLPPQFSRFLNLIRVALIVALALSIAGGSMAASSDESSRNQSGGLRKASSLIFTAAYCVLVVLHGFFWMAKDRLLRYHRLLLVGISCALPFLLVRIIYSILSAFSPLPSFSTSSSGLFSSSSNENSLSKFNTITGIWQTLFFMSVLMEFCVVIIYCTVGTFLPLQKEVQEVEGSGNAAYHDPRNLIPMQYARA